MVVLCALVRVTGLPSAAPLLAQHGLRSPAWRTREGTLRLVMAGLLSWRPLSSPESDTGAETGSRRTSSVSGEVRLCLSKKGSEAGGRGRGDTAALATAADAEEILRQVCSLLDDERPEVSVDPLRDKLVQHDQRHISVHFGVSAPTYMMRPCLGCVILVSGSSQAETHVITNGSSLNAADATWKDLLPMHEGHNLRFKHPRLLTPCNNNKLRRARLDRSLLSPFPRAPFLCLQVRFASVETLAVAANVWGRERVDVSDELEHANLLRSGLQHRDGGGLALR